MFHVTMSQGHLALIDNLEDLEVSTDYSGRFMYGSPCFGIVTSDPLSVLVRITRALIETFGIDDDDETADLLDALSQGAQMDSMGLQSIVYWPHITVDRDGRA